MEEEEEKIQQRITGFEWQRGDLFVKGAEYTWVFIILYIFDFICMSYFTILKMIAKNEAVYHFDISFFHLIS